MSEWIEWKGGNCPVRENIRVDIRFCKGEVRRGLVAWSLCWTWSLGGGYGDIGAYRLSVQQSREEAYDETTRGIQDSSLDAQVAGTHYKTLKIQPVTYIHANNIGFMEGSAIKYLSRWRAKGGVDDLKKAKHFIEMLIELECKLS